MTTTTAHTPGPWVAYGSDRTTHTAVKGADGKAICHMVAEEHDWSNASLIAAAPELLEALQAMINNQGTGAMEWATKQAQAALNKAKGD